MMMRKNNLMFLIPAAGLLLSLTACGKSAGAVSKGDSAMFEEMIRANSIDEVLTRHNIVTIERKSFEQGKELSTEDWHITKDELYIESTTGYASDLTADTYLIADSQNSSLISYISSDPAVYKEWFESTKTQYSLALSPEEVLTSTGEQEDHFHAETLISSDQAVSSLVEAYSEAYGGITYQSGMKLKYAYDFDLTTRDLLNINVYTVDDKGNESLFLTDTYSYEDKDFTTDRNNGPLSAYYDENGLRTVKITYAAGTEHPVTSEYKIAKNMMFVGYHSGNFVTEFYTDEACTKPYDYSDTSVTELYAK
jgi:hypothetical protein